ncbi:MAG TPA: hypothetical protein VG406_01430 [Isosphaeraceae bacterium]|nr:hypothetical protein [Isosphaeraceae bacterium]
MGWTAPDRDDRSTLADRREVFARANEERMPSARTTMNRPPYRTADDQTEER